MNTIDLKSATVDYFHQAWHLGNEAALDKYLHPDTTAHGVGAPTRGLPAFRDWYRSFRNAFSNISCTTSHCLREGDLTAIRITFTGTHTGHSLGAPPSNNAVTLPALCLGRWQDNQIIECFNEFNHHALLTQINAL